MTARASAAQVGAFTKTLTKTANFSRQQTNGTVSELKLHRYVLMIFTSGHGKVEFTAAGACPKPASEIIIGRSPTADICIGFDGSTSWWHAAIGLDKAGRLYVRDLGSKNGTFLNKKQLTVGENTTMEPGDHLSLATNVIRVAKH
jgi:pSer/pThr/pTyr-binding forkhead associated (FHA) protein